MKSRPDPPAAVDLPLARFLDRVRSAFAHDLRTPLGTIVNYAAVLEATPGADAEEVRDLGARIRANAQRASRMLQLVANVTGLASRPLRPVSTDLLALANSVMTDVSGRGRVRASPTTRDTLVDVDAEVIGFAWRAYAAVEHDCRAKSIDDAELEVQRENGHLVLDLRCTTPGAVVDAAAGDSPVEVAAFVRHNGGPDRLESSLGLKLAEELVQSLGGELQLRGRPGSRSGLQLRLPVAD